MKTMIITSYIEGKTEDINKLIQTTSKDFCICADGGYDFALQAGIVPDLVVGDFDSSNKKFSDIEFDNSTETILVPVEKDDTDLQLALKLAIERGSQEIVIIGGIGGRVDHTIGNIQNLVHYSSKDIEISLLDPNQYLTVHHPGTREYFGEKGETFSAFAFTPEVNGVTYEGAYYPLSNHTLTNSFPLGISNHFVDNKITVTTEGGILIVVKTKL